MLKFVITLLLVSLTGCGLTTYSKPVDKLPLAIKDPAELTLAPVTFTVITEKNSTDVFTKMRKNNQTPALIGLSDADYKALATNIQKIKDYLILEKLILQKYRNYYEGTK